MLLFHLHQTSVVVMVATTAHDQQACILQLHPTSSQDRNEHLQREDIFLRFLLCVDLLYFMSKWYFLFLVLLSIHPNTTFQLIFHILIDEWFVLRANTLSQSFQWYRPFSIPWHSSLHFLTECCHKIAYFIRIPCYYVPLVSWAWCGANCIDS